MATELARYEAAVSAVAEAKAVDEILEIRDQARAMAAAARIAKNQEMEIHAAEIRLRAERRLGEMIIAQREGPGLHKGGRPKTGAAREPVSDGPVRLSDVGIDKKLSSRAQRLARVPAHEFEHHMEQMRDELADVGARISGKLLNEGEKAERRERNRAAHPQGGTITDLARLRAAGAAFGVIYADPPWAYETWSDAGTDRSAVQHYDTMPSSDIATMPVAELGADDSLLHLWVPGSMFEDGQIVVEAWGYTYKKIGFIWLKKTLDGAANKIGNGHWTRDEAEVCILATRGKPERLDAGVRQVLEAPVGAHSAKPDEFRDRIRRLSAGPYLELFGRKPVAGWMVWGNQVAFDESTLEIPGFLRRQA